MSSDVTAAVLERLRAQLPPVVTVYDGTVLANPPGRYVVVYGDIGTVAALAIDGMPVDASYTVQTTAVTVDPYVAGDCRWLSRRVRDLLAGWHPVADDTAAAGLFECPVSQRPARDESVPDRHVWFAVNQFAVKTVNL